MLTTHSWPLTKNYNNVLDTCLKMQGFMEEKNIFRIFSFLKSIRRQKLAHHFLQTNFFPPTPGCMSMDLILIWRKPKALMAPNPHQRQLLFWSFRANIPYLASHSRALQGNRFLGSQRFTGHRHCPFNELCHHAWSMPSNLSGRGRVTVALPRSSAACLHRKATAQVTACFVSRWKAPLEMEVARAETGQLILINQCLLIDGKSHLLYIQKL